MKCILTLIACSALAPLSQAFQLRNLSLPYPSGVITGTNPAATQASVGFFSDDTIRDAAVLCGGHIYLAYAPERWDSLTPTSGTNGPFTSMTKVNLPPDPATGVPRDGILASSSAGIILVTWDSANRCLSGGSTSLTDSSWQNATQLQTVNFNGNINVCALASNGHTILFAGWDAATHALTNPASFSPTTNTIQTLAGLNWGVVPSPNERMDFAYDDGTGLYVLYPDASLSPQPLFTYSNSCATFPPRLLTLPGSSTDQLIWLTKDPAGSGEEVLTVARNSTSHPLDAFIYFGTMTAAGMMLADVDADARKDVVITQSGSHYAWVLHQQPPTSSMVFFDTTMIVQDLTGAYGTCTTAPAMAAGDLDGDGDDDLLFFGSVGCGADQAIFAFGNGLDEESVFSDEQFKVWMNGGITWQDGSGTNPSTLTFSPWDPPTISAAQSATDIHVTIWGRQTRTGAMDSYRLVDDFKPTGGLTPPAVYTVNVTKPVSQLPQYIVVSFNYVVRNGSGAITRSFPSWVGQINRFASIQGGGDDGSDDDDLYPDAGGMPIGGITRPRPPPCDAPPNP